MAALLDLKRHALAFTSHLQSCQLYIGKIENEELYHYIVNVALPFFSFFSPTKVE